MKHWRFVCNAGTRPQCLRRQIVADTEHREVSPGDIILLYDLSENHIYGPMTAVTECKKEIVTDGWGGSYPFQIRVSWDELYRISSSEYPQIENNRTLPERKFRRIIEHLQHKGEQLIIPESGSRMGALTEDVVPEPGIAEIETARGELLSQLDQEPPDTEPVTYEPSEQIARDRAFRRSVLRAYDECCAFCGIHRETPEGHPEAEAAHIRPKSEGGPDDIRNGIALCKLHHWAFDNGWLTVTTDHTISVTSAPARDGYEEFSNLEGKKIRLPDDERMHPAPKFLQ